MYRVERRGAWVVRPTVIKSKRKRKKVIGGAALNMTPSVTSTPGVKSQASQVPSRGSCQAPLSGSSRGFHRSCANSKTNRRQPRTSTMSCTCTRRGQRYSALPSNEFEVAGSIPSSSPVYDYPRGGPPIMCTATNRAKSWKKPALIRSLQN